MQKNVQTIDNKYVQLQAKLYMQLHENKFYTVTGTCKKKMQKKCNLYA